MARRSQPAHLARGGEGAAKRSAPVADIERCRPSSPKRTKGPAPRRREGFLLCAFIVVQRLLAIGLIKPVTMMLESIPGLFVVMGPAGQDFYHRAVNHHYVQPCKKFFVNHHRTVIKLDEMKNGLESLTYIAVSGYYVTDLNLRAFPIGLRSLVTTGTIDASPGALGALTNLTHLRIWRWQIPAKQVFPMLPKLRKLYLGTTHRGLKTIAKLTTLTDLSWERGHAYTRMLRHLTRLRVLRARGSDLLVGASLCGLTRLEELDVSYCPKLRVGDIPLLPRLTHLSVARNWSTTDLDLMAYRNVRYLDVRDCHRLTLAVFDFMVNLKAIRDQGCYHLHNKHSIPFWPH